jgi:glycosyltransferase involved in cell wall biosynthesis
MSKKGKVKICVNTQTPPVRFKSTYSELIERYGFSSQELTLNQLTEGADYDYTPGGVTAMVLPALKRMIDQQMIERSSWVSLGPNAPKQVVLDEKIKLYNIFLDRQRLASYANFKEGIWSEIHGLGKLEFRPGEYEAYVTYNWACAKLMLQMLNDVDVFWIHDFQQLHVGNMIGPSAPAVLRWHIPFRLDKVSPRLSTLIMKNIEGFDAVIVSTRKDLEGLIRAGYKGHAYAIYPYIDIREWKASKPAEAYETRAKLSLKSGDRILLVVARMDPVKSQDVAIKALSKLQNKYQDLKLVLVGNGSFTSSPKGGLGHPKSVIWKENLEGLIRSLKLEESVIFAGHVNRQELYSLYKMAEVVVVPSSIEGFNLTAVEGWIHSKPCVVSSGVGVSELVHDGVNGYVFSSSNCEGLVEKLDIVLRSPESAMKLGENGERMAGQCDVSNAVKQLQEVFDEASQMYSS